MSHFRGMVHKDCLSSILEFFLSICFFLSLFYEGIVEMTTPSPSLRQSLSQVFNRYDITFLLNAQDAIRLEFTHVKPLLQTFA